MVILLPLIQEGSLWITSQSMCMKYWLIAWSSLPRKKVWLGELTMAVDGDVKQQTKKDLTGNFAAMLRP